MLATAEIKKIKSSLRAKAIRKIFIEDDVLKIQYRNRNGGYDDVVFNNLHHPDLSDIETFLLNVVKGYKCEKVNQSLLGNFGKAICNQLIKVVDSRDVGFGELQNIKFGRFIINSAVDLVLRH